MRLVASIQSLSRLEFRDRKLVVEALAELALCSAAIAWLPFRRVIELGSLPLPPCRPNAAEAVVIADRARWSVEALAWRVPRKAMCFQKGLALQRILRRRGIDAQLHYGIAKEFEGKLAAHVWIAAQDRVVVGGEFAADYREVAVFPGR